MTGRFGLRVGDRNFFLTGHAMIRMRQRGIREAEVVEVLSTIEPFTYYHEGEWKDGYYDPARGLLVAVAEDRILTVMSNVPKSYIDDLPAGGQ